MKYKIVCDSSANLHELSGVDYEYVSLHVTVNGLDFIDNDKVDLVSMQASLKAPKCHSSTACPSPDDWVNAFGDADAVFCVTITSELSGSCASAHAAKRLYEDEHPDRNVYIIDSLSTGPEMVLIAERIKELIDAGFDAERIYRETCLYIKSTHLLFSLGSINNLASNGRVSTLLAKGVGLLGMRIIGKASDIGKLQPIDRARGDRRALVVLLKLLHEHGYNGGRLIISHTDNEAAAIELRALIEQDFGPLDIRIMPNGALCGYYAEPMSVLIGFEA